MPDLAPRMRLLPTAALVAVVLALTGCAAASTPPSPATAPALTATPPASEAPTASTASAVTCAEVEPLAASITAGFSFSSDDSSEDPSSTTCVWTNGAVDAASSDLDAYASLAISIDGTGWSAEELELLPGATDDPRVTAIDGRVLMGTPADTLGDAGSVQVLFPQGTVTVVATGALATASADTAIPVDTVIGVASEVAELRR